MDGVDGVGGEITDCGADNEDADADYVNMFSVIT